MKKTKNQKLMNYVYSKIYSNKNNSTFYPKEVKKAILLAIQTKEKQIKDNYICFRRRHVKQEGLEL